MSTHIDFRTLPSNVPVLCIPRVYPNINESRIRKIIDDLHMGTLERIDIVSKQSERGEKFNRVFVHFRHWNHSENANIARERLLNGKEIKIIYDDPWFWKISAYKEVERRSPPPSTNTIRRPVVLTFDSDQEKPARPTSKQYPSNNYSNRDNRYEKNDNYKRCYKYERPKYENNERQRPRDERPSNPTIHKPMEDNPDENKVEHPLINYGNITLPPARRRIYKKVNTTNEDTPIQNEIENK